MARWLQTCLLLILAGCATTAKKGHVAWPAPPATERIRYLTSYGGEGDLEGAGMKFWRKLAGMEAPRHLFHPVGVAVSRDGTLLAVSDQALAEVFIFDLAARKLNVIPKETLAGTPVGVAIDGDTVWVTVPERKLALAFGPDASPRRSLDFADCERPTGIAIDSSNGLVYVADTSRADGEGHTVHVHGLTGGEHRANIGKKGTGPGELFFPVFVNLANDGNLVVADTMNARVMEFESNGTFVRQYGERGDRLGQMDKPKGVATDSFGNVYVVDSFFSGVTVFNREAKPLLIFGGRGQNPGFMSNPGGVAIDDRNRIYVADGLNFRVLVYELVNTTAGDSQLQVAPPVSP